MMAIRRAGIIKKIATIYVKMSDIMDDIKIADDGSIPFGPWFEDKAEQIQTYLVLHGAIELSDISKKFKGSAMTIDVSVKEDTLIEPPVFFEVLFDDIYEEDVLDISVYSPAKVNESSIMVF